MTYFSKLPRWLPLTVLAVLALTFEPVWAGFVFANQSCELLMDWDKAKGSIFNSRHLISYGILCFAAALTFRRNRIVKAVILVFLFSAFLEFEQSFFITGHCRSWDLIPNLLGIGVAACLFRIGEFWLNRTRHFKSD